MPCVTIPLPPIPSLPDPLSFGIRTPNPPNISIFPLPPLCCVIPIKIPPIPPIPLPQLKAAISTPNAASTVIALINANIALLNTYYDNIQIPCPND